MKWSTRTAAAAAFSAALAACNSDKPKAAPAMIDLDAVETPAAAPGAPKTYAGDLSVPLIGGDANDINSPTAIQVRGVVDCVRAISGNAAGGTPPTAAEMKGLIAACGEAIGAAAGRAPTYTKPTPETKVVKPRTP